MLIDRLFPLILNCVFFFFFYSSSQTQCVDLGGNLASVHSRATQKFLRTFVKKHANGVTRTWIGGHDATQVAYFPF